jgi:chromate transporter
MDEVMDFYTVSQIMPGLIGVNLSIFVGNKRKGVFAGILAALGFVLPGVTLITAVSLFISNFTEIDIVKHAFAGVRIAVAALILDTVIKLIKGVFKEWKSLVLFIIVFALSAIPAGVLPAFFTSPAFLVALSGIVGFFMFRGQP